MEEMFKSAWNSSAALNKWFAVFSLLTLLAGILSPIFGMAAYKLSQRRDFLKDEAANAAEQSRKAEVIRLNARIAETANLATSSVTKLALAEDHLSRSQNELAAATEEATKASLGFAEAQSKIRELELKGKKVVTLELRSEITLEMQKPINITGTTTMMHNFLAFWGSSQLQAIRFQANQSVQRQLGDKKLFVITNLQPDDPLSTSGLDIVKMDGRSIIETNAIQMIRDWEKQGSSITHWRWILVLNGAAFPLIDSDTPRTLATASGERQLIDLLIPPGNQSPSKGYQALFE